MVLALHYTDLDFLGFLVDLLDSVVLLVDLVDTVAAVDLGYTVSVVDHIVAVVRHNSVDLDLDIDFDLDNVLDIVVLGNSG